MVVERPPGRTLGEAAAAKVRGGFRHLRLARATRRYDRRAAPTCRIVAPVPDFCTVRWVWVGRVRLGKDAPMLSRGAPRRRCAEDGRRARIMAAVTGADATGDASELMQRLCRLAVDEMDLSGCAVVLMSGADSASVVAASGRHARTVPGLQMDLGEGPCLDAHARGIPVLLPDLSAQNASRWPAFRGGRAGGRRARRVLLPLTVGPGGIGTLDLCRDRPGMLTEEPGRCSGGGGYRP